MLNKDLIFKVKLRNINVGYTFADNEGRAIQGLDFYASNKFSVTANSTSFELTTLSYGGYLAWYPKGREAGNVYYGIIIQKDNVVLAHFNEGNPEENYTLSLATEQFVNNKITGAINSNY